MSSLRELTRRGRALREIAATMERRSAVYVRVSTRKQAGNYPRLAVVPRPIKDDDEGDVATDGPTAKVSLLTQEQGCHERAAAEGRRVADEDVHFDVFTGTKLWERPGISALRDKVARGEVDRVYVYATDRLARKAVHFDLLIEEFRHHGCEVEFVTDKLDDTPEGRFMGAAKSYADERENERRRDRVQRTKRFQREHGRVYLGGIVRYGYRLTVDKAGYEVDEEAGAVVLRIGRECVGGKSIRRAAVDLNLDGVPTPNPERSAREAPTWTHGQVQHILTSRIYRGEGPGGTVVPAIFDPDLAAAIDQRLAFNLANAPRRNKDPRATLLRGLVRCGYCGRVMGVRWNRKRWLRYVCPSAPAVGVVDERCAHSISSSVLDQAIWGMVEAIWTDEAVVEGRLAELRADDPTDEDVASVERGFKKLGVEEANIVASLRGLGEDGYARRVLLADLEALGKRRALLEAERAQVVARQASWAAAQDRLASIHAYRRRVGARLHGADYEGRIEALLGLDAGVRVWRPGDGPGGHRWELRTVLDPSRNWPAGVGADGAFATRPSTRSSRNQPLVLTWAAGV